MSSHSRTARTLRWLAVGLMIGLGAYWAGSRYGDRTPSFVSAIPPSDSTGNAVLDPAEAENVRIYKQASPSVANILTKTVEYDFFFNPVPVEGAGSGFLIDSDGHILTNFHVVQGAQTIEVTFADHTNYKARLIGADTVNDIALIQITAKGHRLVPLPLGDSRNLQVGQRVLAIGNPFGLQNTLTTGVVSSLGRTVQTGDNTFIDEAIQTDAAINRGNSGGPLLNSRGQVIGINSALLSPSGASSVGIGFAIPINTAKRVAQDLIEHGRVRRATLGVEGRTLWPDLAEALGLPVQRGVLIESVNPGGAAANAGVRGGNRTVLAGLRELRIGGDVIVAVNGDDVNSRSDLNLLLNRARPGDNVIVTVVRAGRKMNVPVTLGDG
ncbi:MAG TPA: trypsin-like peptidase domain-containing protein [Candidatus Acidoferrales bacterium]|nr:trypsin-like peptidase domain-containing protein [Candidatus Acidoferrales bacterium]